MLTEIKKSTRVFTVSVIWMIGWVVGAHYKDVIGDLAGVLIPFWVIIFIATMFIIAAEN